MQGGQKIALLITTDGLQHAHVPLWAGGDLRMPLLCPPPSPSPPLTLKHALICPILSSRSAARVKRMAAASASSSAMGEKVLRRVAICVGGGG